MNNRLDWYETGNDWKIRNEYFSNDGTFDVGTKSDNYSWDACNHVKNSLTEQELNWLKQVLIQTNCDLNNSYICLGNTITPFMEAYSKKNMKINQNDVHMLQQQGKVLHTLPPKEKWEKLQDFRNTRDEKNGKMLGKMTMAQYHNLIRQECKKYINNIIKENITMAIFLQEDSQELNKQRFSLSKKGREKLNSYIAQMEAFGLQDHDGYKMLKHLSDEEYNQGKKKIKGKVVKDENIHTEKDKQEKPQKGVLNKTVEGGIHRNKETKDKITHAFTDWVYGRNGELTLKHKTTQNRLDHTATVPKLPKKQKPTTVKPIKPINAKDGSQIHLMNEYHSQLHINFDDPNYENSSIYNRPNYEHFIDYLESIGYYGTLPQTNITIGDVYDENMEDAIERFKLEESDMERLLEKFYYYAKNYKDYWVEDCDPQSLESYDIEDSLSEEGKNAFEVFLRQQFNDNLYMFETFTWKNKNSTQIEIERVISIPSPENNSDDSFNQFSNYKGIGNCWTWEKGNGNSYCSRGGQDITLKGKVNVCDIDWVETIMRNGWDLNEEKEIFLKDDIFVQIDEVEYCNKNFPLKQPILVKSGDSQLVYENKNKKSIILTEEQIKLLKEYRNELNIPFEEYGGGKQMYEHYLDYLEKIGTYGELPPSNMKNISRMVYRMLEGKKPSDFIDDYDRISQIMSWVLTSADYESYFINPEEAQNCCEEELCEEMLTEEGNLEVLMSALCDEGFPDKLIINDKGLIYIERVIGVDDILSNKDIYYEYVDQWKNLGECWSWAKGGAISFGSDNVSKNYDWFILHGWVRPEDVDWDTTIRCNADCLYYERELRLNYNAPIQIDRIECKGTNINGCNLPLKKPIILHA